MVPEALASEFAALAAASDLETAWEAAKFVTPLLAVCGLWFKAGQWEAKMAANIVAHAEKVEANTKLINDKTEESTKLINTKTEENTKLINEKADEIVKLINAKNESNTKLINDKAEANTRLIADKTGANTAALDVFRDEVRTELAIMRADVRALADKFERINYDVAFLTGYRTAQEGSGKGAPSKGVAPKLPRPPRG